MSADFHAYPKIPARPRRDAPSARAWVAAEKIHGAHFAVICDRDGVRPAKRRELLGGDGLDTFFGVSRIWPAMAVAAARCAAQLRCTAPDVIPDDATVTLYGELAGGAYPHPDVRPASGVTPVQTGVWYAPDLHWFLFDAAVDTGTTRSWIADRALRVAAADAGLPCAPLLGQGSRTALQELAVRFPSRVPDLLGLPPIDGNEAEGYVLKPADPWPDTAGERPVVKAKQPAFAEDARFAGSRPYLPPLDGAAGIPAWLVVEAAALLTPTRAASATGKLGPTAAAATVAAEITDDIVTELADALGGLTPVEQSSLRAALLPGAHTLATFDTAARSAPTTGRVPAR